MPSALHGMCPVDCHPQLDSLMARVPDAQKPHVENLVMKSIAAGFSWTSVISLVSSNLPTVLAAFGVTVPAAVTQLILDALKLLPITA
jgi:hypothetical protein